MVKPDFKNVEINTIENRESKFDKSENKIIYKDVLDTLTFENNNLKNWLEGDIKKDNGKNEINQVDLKKRFDTLLPNLPQFLEHLENTDPNFKYNLNQKSLDMNQDYDKAVSKIKKNFVGSFAEKIVIAVFSPYFEKINLQKPQESEGRITKVDIECEKAKKPFVFNNGNYVNIGGNINCEVKSGQKEYFVSQKEHMGFQSKGHTGDANITITTKNIADLKYKNEEIRESLRDTSPIFKYLPRKEVLDEVCVQYISNYNKRKIDY